MPECLIGFGANLSNPKANFRSAAAQLEQAGLRIRKTSGLWSSPAWPPGSDQPDYINAVVSGYFSGEAETLMDHLLRIEAEHGRARSVPNAARTLDLDLLTFGQERRETDHLTLPHPRMMERAFVLVPLCEIHEKWVRHVHTLPDEDVRAVRYVGAW